MKKSKFSTQHLKYLRKAKLKTVLVHSIQVGVLLVTLLLWEILVQYKILDGFIVSSPSRVWNTLWTFNRNGSIFWHMWVSTYETILGFAVGTTLGYVIAVLLWWNETLQRILEPYLVVLNSLPKIALGPMIILLVGTGKASIVTMAVLVSVIITTITLLNGFVETDPGKILLMKSMHATRRQIFTKLVAPANIPALTATLKINVGMSWVGSIMGEYIVSREGLGNLLVYGAQTLSMDLVMTCTFCLCALAGVMYAIVAGVEKIIIKHR